MSTIITKHETAAIVPMGVWRIDPAHSTIGFAVKHMMIATVRGRFQEFEGTVEVAALGGGRAYGTVSAASIDTGDRERDAHLRSADFLDAERHPELRFVSDSIEAVGDRGLKVVGQLTIRGVTRLVELEAEVGGSGRDPWGHDRVALELRGEIDRREFGLTWNRGVEAGGVLVGDKVKLVLDVSAVRVEAAGAEQAAA